MEKIIPIKDYISSLDRDNIYLLANHYGINAPASDIPWIVAIILTETKEFSASMEGDCVIQNVAKYKLRPGPPYKAGACPDVEMMGNDGKRYKSLPNASGIYTWRKISAPTKGAPKIQAKKPAKKSSKKASKKKSAKKATKKKSSKKPVKKSSKKSAKKSAKKDYSKMLVKELREELKKHGLPVSGVKKELIERLESTVKQQQKKCKSKKGSQKGKPGTGCVLKNACPQRYTLPELKVIAKSCGITNLNQKKKDLCVSIKGITAPTAKGTRYDVVSQGVMLANEYLNKKTGKPTIDPVGWFASEKFDGVRAVWNGQDFISRSGIKFNAPDSYKKYLPNNVVSDGELFIGRDKFQETISIVRHKTPNEEDWARIKYNVFDVPLSKGT